MAQEEHLACLKQGGDHWNRWRHDHPEIRPDQSGVDLRSADLTAADLSDADLSAADLYYAFLTEADLHGADLSDAHLSGAILNSADLSGAHLSYAILSGAILNRTRFQSTILEDTTFTNTDLTLVHGLETIVHSGPSIVDLNSVLLPRGPIREHFLRGVGFPNSVIEYYDALYTLPIQFDSCFLSYHHATDHAFAKRLSDDLQRTGVRCWLDRHDLQPGHYYLKHINAALRSHDKVILLLSQGAVNSGWVEAEVMHVLTREHQERREILFPLRLDEAILTTTVEWARDLRDTRHIADWTVCLEDEAVYHRELAHIISQLTKPLSGTSFMDQGGAEHTPDD